MNRRLREPTAQPSRIQDVGAALAHPRFRVVLVVAPAAFVAVVALHSQSSLEQLRQLGSPEPVWLGVGVVAEALSLWAYASIVRRLLGLAGVTARTRVLLRATLAGIAMGASLPAGQGASAVYWYKELRREGADQRIAGFAMTGSMLAGALSLGVLTITGAGIAGGAGPLASAHAWLVAAGVGVLGARVLFRKQLGKFVAHISRRLGGERLDLRRGAASRCLRLVAGLAYANWLLDCASLYAALASVHAHVPLPGVLVVYALAQLVASLPVLPGGGGTVELALVGSFSAFHPSGDGRILVGVLLFRVISCWGLVPVGWLGVILGRTATGTRDDPRDPAEVTTTAVF